MKRSPDMEHLEEILRSHKLSLDGFLGHDERNPQEIIEEDCAAVFRLGQTLKELAKRMRYITDVAEKGLENTVRIDDVLQARVTEIRGSIICPWPHPKKFYKRVTTVERNDTGESIQWSDLSIHMIEEHGFFEGRGSNFRLDPHKLIRIIFPK